jgi:hypothetical protein
VTLLSAQVLMNRITERLDTSLHFSDEACETVCLICSPQNQASAPNLAI